MPSKNVIKQYASNTYYHVYNRGVDRALIFRDDKDYKTFLSYLQLYVDKADEGQTITPSRQIKNYFGEIELLAYCLMPNHFHILLKQNSDRGMDHFMRSLSTKYVRYFNTSYHRIGPLFQGPYKAVAITNEYQFTYLSKYIHRNPLDLAPYKESPCRLHEYAYSSYGNYLHKFFQSWITTDTILYYFSTTHRYMSYASFVEQEFPDDIQPILKETIDIE